MKQLLIIIFGYFLSNGFSVESKEKNYMKYHRGFAQVEEFIVNEKFIEAELKLDILFGEYTVKFAKDYLIAAQICLINGHQNKGVEYIRCVFINALLFLLLFFNIQSRN